MTHRLVPPFILEQHARGARHGRFEAAALFVDISGFSAVTDALMRHGQHGAEVMATLMRTVFDPLVASVFARGGFVTNFAGDAFTAVFPTRPEPSTDPHLATLLHAFAAARDIQAAMTINAIRPTPYGDFPFSAKVGVAAGTAEWGIVESQDAERAAFYFKGTAVTGAAHAEHHARAGDIILCPVTGRTLQAVVAAEPVADHWRVTAVADATLLPGAQPVNLRPFDVDTAVRFVPRRLIEQTIPGEFRQVINLFISLQGAPSHAELDTFMDRFFALQARYGGFCNRIDFGDKGCHILMFWGAPTAHENDVARVCNFVLDLRSGSAIPLRAGLTYRIAHAGMIGSELAEEYTCYGRGVNLAARHMVAADWGDIWIDGDLARRISGAFVVHAHGRHRFKGFAEEQPVYLLAGRELALSQIIYDHPLVGREAELGVLATAVEPLRHGRFGGVAAVIGEPGIGKSRLMHEFLQSPQVAEAHQVFLCQSDEILRQSLNPFRYFLRQYFAQFPNLGEAVNKQAFTAALDDLTAVTDDPDLRAELDRTRSFLGALVDLRWEESLYEQLEPQLRFENTLSALKTLLKAESHRQPVIIQLEDAHWLDADSVELLQTLTRNVDDVPLLILITSRTPISPGWFAPDTPLETIMLAELTGSATGLLSRAILGREPSDTLLALLEERTQGNPFFVEQLLLYMQENSLIAPDTRQAAPLRQELMLPTDVRALLTARLDQLPGELKEVVQKAAVLGREFDVEILAQMVAADPLLDVQLRTAEQEAVWFALSELRYLFKHALLRDAAYDMQVQSRLRQLHRLAATAFEQLFVEPDERELHFAEIAYHFDRARVVDRARDYYVLAADHGRERYQNDLALSYYTRARALTPADNPDSLARILLGMEAIYNLLGQREEQRAVLEALEPVSAACDDLMRGRVALRHSAYELAIGNYEQATAVAQEAAAFAARAGDSRLEASALQRIGRTLWQGGRHLDARPYLEQALALARQTDHPLEEAESLYDLAVIAYFAKAFDRAQTHLQQALDVYQVAHHQLGEIRCLNLSGAIAYNLGDYANARTFYDASLTLCRDVGWRYGESSISANIGNIFFDLGGYADARTYLQQGLTICRETGDREQTAVILDTLGLVLHYQGELGNAQASFEESLEILENTQNQRSRGYTLTHLGYTLVALRDLDAAETQLAQALAIRQELADEAAIIDVRGGLTAVLLARGQLVEAAEQARDMLDWMQVHGVQGLELPLQLYLICTEALQQAAKRHPRYATAADEALSRGLALLDERVVRIKDTAVRRQYREQVPFNRRLVQAGQRRHTAVD